MTTRTIDAGISVKHAKTWNISEAIRELVQNWLDVRNEFQCAGSITWKDGMATIKDAGPGLQLKHLAFGENDKAAGSIGQFGEGMKSAFIVLIRNGRKIEIRSQGKSILPVIANSDSFEIDTLHYEISDLAPRFAAKLQGTMIHVECTEDELATAKNYFVELVRQEKKAASKKAKREGRKVEQSDLKVGFKWLEKGKISEPGGMIYVKGSVIGTISDARFSYHLEGVTAEQATNRDRNAVNMDKVEPIIREMIASTSSTKVMDYILTDLVGKGNQKSWESRLSLRAWSSKSARIWHRVWNKKFGEKWLLAYNSLSDRKAEYRGYRVLTGLDWNKKNFLSDIGLKDTSNFEPKETSERLTVIGVRSLTPEQRSALKWSVEMVKKYYAETGKVVVVEQCHYGWVGEYDPSKDTIFVNQSQLDNLESALHTILHETVHKVTGYADETASFERALLMVSVKMIMANNVK